MTNNIFFDEVDVANIKCLHHSSATEGKRYAAKLDSSWYAAYWQMGPIKGVAKKWGKQTDQKLKKMISRPIMIYESKREVVLIDWKSEIKTRTNTNHRRDQIAWRGPQVDTYFKSIDPVEKTGSSIIVWYRSGIVQEVLADLKMQTRKQNERKMQPINNALQNWQ